ncbi:MAG: hypothetical protein ACJA04_000686 [Cellvibrionaceae bacterium]
MAIIVSLRLLMPGEAQMIIQFDVERCLDRNLGQHLSGLVEIRFSFDVFSGRLGDRL